MYIYIYIYTHTYTYISSLLTVYIVLYMYMYDYKLSPNGTGLRDRNLPRLPPTLLPFQKQSPDHIQGLQVKTVVSTS